jgi:hypothetical protein
MQELEQMVQRDTAEAAATVASMSKSLRTQLDLRMKALLELQARFDKARPRGSAAPPSPAATALPLPPGPERLLE